MNYLHESSHSILVYLVVIFGDYIYQNNSQHKIHIIYTTAVAAIVA